MASAALARANKARESMGKTLTGMRKKMKEMKFQERATRMLYTGTAVLGGAGAGIIDEMIEPVEIGGVDVPMSAFAGAVATFVGHMGEPGSTGADFALGTGNGMLAGATYELTRNAWSSWGESDEG